MNMICCRRWFLSFYIFNVVYVGIRKFLVRPWGRRPIDSGLPRQYLVQIVLTAGLLTRNVLETAAKAPRSTDKFSLFPLNFCSISSIVIVRPNGVPCLYVRRGWLFTIDISVLDGSPPWQSG